MFKNIGGRIKDLAGLMTVLGCIVSLVYGIIVMVEGAILLGILILIAGVFISWVSSFTLYGFGELIEKTSRIEENTKQQLELTRKNNNIEDDVKPTHSSISQADIDEHDEIVAPESRRKKASQASTSKLSSKENGRCCPNCNTRILEDIMTFCPKCGTPLDKTKK